MPASLTDRPSDPRRLSLECGCQENWEPDSKQGSAPSPHAQPALTLYRPAVQLRPRTFLKNSGRLRPRLRARAPIGPEVLEGA